VNRGSFCKLSLIAQSGSEVVTWFWLQNVSGS